MTAALAAVAVIGALLVSAGPVSADGARGAEYLRDARELYSAGQYFKTARYAFAAQEYDPSLAPEAYSWITLGLIRAGLHNSAAYFFIRTLQSGNDVATRRVLAHTQVMMVRSGGADLLRRYLIRHTKYDDYDSVNRSAYLYALGKDALLGGKEERAIGYLNAVSHQSPLWPYALQLRGSAHAILGRDAEAVRDFSACADKSDDYVARAPKDAPETARERARDHERQLRKEADDLRARCQAGEARTLYQMDRFQEADRAFDRIPKASFVWPDILFEQAWNSFGRREYNRTLGKLVSYKSPALTFVFNTEVDVLRAQTYLALCQYGDANEVINEFYRKFTNIKDEVKVFVERNSSNLGAFYDQGKAALQASLHTRNDFHRLSNRFVRGPYFQNLVEAEKALHSERAAIRQFNTLQPGVERTSTGGFPGFLDQVLAWRLKTVRLLGGAFVKNSLMDYHSVVIADFEKIDFIKLEMLGRAKDKLIYKKSGDGERSRGNVRPSRRDDQLYWSFNGEFWNDELGDYVFGLETQCES